MNNMEKRRSFTSTNQALDVTKKTNTEKYQEYGQIQIYKPKRLRASAGGWSPGPDDGRPKNNKTKSHRTRQGSTVAPIKKKGTARAVKVKDMFRAFILTLVEAYESNEDTYGYTYWDIVRGIRMANERHAITDGEVDSLCYKMNCTREEMLTA